MKILVQKFGGTSLDTDDKRKLAATKVFKAIEQGYNVVVVVSAMGRKGESYATDTLISLVEDNGNTVISKKDLDVLMACGEIISGVVMVSVLKGRGIDATCFTGGQAGIITDDTYNDARIIQVKPSEIIRELEDGKVVVVTGFQGITKQGKITTLGRGGSDTTAAALGVALKAERIEIYTDVDGIKTADPRIVNTAKTIENVTYNEICQLAHEGAKVIHPRAVEIAMQGNIPMRIKNTFSDAPGTLVSNVVNKREPATDIKNDKLITGITQKQNVSQITVNYDKNDDTMPSNLFDVMASASISLDFININETNVIFTVKDTERKIALATLAKFNFNVNVTPNCAKVAAVGAGMTGVPGVMAKIVEALTDCGIKILQSADSYTSIWCLVHQQDMEKAVRALHKKFQLG